ncbi:TIGR04255 family protein [Variovorax sp. J31P179]|uniref:TIGR04255 family protein n=1 Tax=Variovorax sp. J31P179 TaxID=3053508 RepID=UPI0025771073|nr:TIGR04255 family protein [Variovorax sp. J31P179]MDM0081636.1 TIGR04255 family protein [Variovorax sp. J31P179]
MATEGAQDRFEPLHDAHAIEQLVATIQFEQPLSDEAIRAGIGAMASFQSKLKGFHDIRGVGFQFGPGGVIPMAQTQNAPADGHVRFATDEAGVVLRELRLDRQSLVFRTQAYTRWDAIWTEAQTYISEILPVLGEASVSAFALHYIDKFLWTGRPDKCRPGPLFRPGSPYLAPRSLESDDLWHCHSGQFRTASPEAKRLEVVDIDCIDEAMHRPPSTLDTHRVVRISTVITDRFNQPGYKPRKVDCKSAMGVASESFPALHTELKRVFSEILSDEYAVRVGMNANAG